MGDAATRELARIVRADGDLNTTAVSTVSNCWKGVGNGRNRIAAR